MIKKYNCHPIVIKMKIKAQIMRKHSFYLRSKLYLMFRGL